MQVLRNSHRHHHNSGQDAAAAYRAKILATGPIAYWPLYETAGAVAANLGSLGAAANGAYTGVTLADAAGPNGDPCPFFDGANDYTNIYSPALNAAMLGGAGDEGSMMCWARVSGAGVWADGVDRRIVNLGAGVDYIYISRSATNNFITFAYRASGGGALFDSVSGVVGPNPNWIPFALTWTHAGGDELTAYVNDVQFGLTQTGLATWITALLAAGCHIGAYNATPLKVWSGWLAHAAMWDRPLTPAEVAALAVV